MKSAIRRSQRCPLVGDVGRPVWTFLLGPSSGPREILVKSGTGGQDTISVEMSIFPKDCAVARTTTAVNNKPYLIYFDRERYTTDRSKCTYIFIRLCHEGTACDFSVENDFPDVIRLLTM